MFRKREKARAILRPQPRAGGLPGIVLALLVAAFGPGGAAALEFECVAQIGGPTRSVALDGTMAYLAQGHSLVTIDVSDPTRPIERGRLLLPEAGEGRGKAMRVAASNGRAFVVFQSTKADWFQPGGAYGFHVVDVEDPAEPAILATLQWTDWMQDLVLEGDLLYVVGQDLRIFDVSGPAAPSLIGSLSGVHSRRAALSGSCLVLAGLDSWSIVDTSDPTAPRVVHEGDFGARDVVVRDSLAYLGGTGVRIYDIGDPAAPVQVGVSNEAGGEGIGLVGSLLFGGHGGSFDYSIMDVSDPASPSLVRFSAFDDIYVNGDPEDVQISGSLVYVAWSDMGLLIVSLEEPTDPRIVGSVRPPIAVESIDVSGSVACVGLHNGAYQERGSFRCIDVSNPRKPFLYISADIINPLGSHGDDHASFTVASFEGIAYGADYQGEGSDTIRIVDIRDPARPVLLGEYEGCSDVEALSLEARDGLLFVRGDDGFMIYDISSPGAPSCLGTVPGRSINSMYLEGDLAYLAGEDVLRIFDISNPASPAQVGVLPPMTGTGAGLAVFRGTAYLNVYGSGPSLIVDVTDPQAPSVLAETSMGAICGSGGGMLAIDRSTGARLLDISDPTGPRNVGAFPPLLLQTYEDGAIVFSEGYAYLRTTDLGVVIYHVGDRSPDSIRDKLLGRSRDPLAVDPSDDGVMDIGDLIDALE